MKSYSSTTTPTLAGYAIAAFSMVLFGLALLSGCANVSVRKVPTPTQYGKWDDADQANADAISGFRYYLPRPFVAVKKEFPIASETRLANGFLAPDGRVVDINPAAFPRDWGLTANPTAWAGAEPVVANDSDLLIGRATAQGGTPLAQGGGLPATPNLRFWELATAVAAVPNSKHLGSAGQPFSVTFTISKVALGISDCKVGTIRAFYLAPFKEGKLEKIDRFYSLPMSLFSPGAGDTCSLEMKNAILAGVSAGNYVYAVRFVKTVANVTEEYIAYAPLGAAQLSVGTGWIAGQNPDVGTSDLPQSKPPVRVRDITMTKTANIAGPAEKVDLTFEFDFAKVRTLDNKLIDGLTVTTNNPGFGTVTAMGLVPEINGQPNMDAAVRLPYDKKKVDFIGTVNYQKTNSKLLSPGNYALVAWVTTNGGTDNPVTTPVVSESSVLNVGSLVSRVPDIEMPPGLASAPATGTPTPVGNSPAASPAVPAPAAVGNGVVNATTQQQVPSGQMALNLGGDPSNAPVTPVNEFFDLVTLPDFEEQYAIEAKPRLSSTTMELALEQGWLLERAGVVIDNKAIAQFLFDQVSKTLDVARDLVKLDKGLLAPAVAPTPVAQGGTAQGGAEIPSAQGGTARAANRPALFKIHRRIIAVPGLYPLLKPREIQRAVAKAAEAAAAQAMRTTGGWGEYQTAYLHELLQQGSLVRFTTREEYVIELLTFSQPQGNGNRPERKESTQPNALPTQAELQAIADTSQDFKDIEVAPPQANRGNIKVLVQLKSGGEVSAARRKLFEDYLNANARKPGTDPFTVDRKIVSP